MKSTAPVAHASASERSSRCECSARCWPWLEARNEAVLASPEELQNDPHGEGWLLLVRPSDPSQIEALMDAATYSGKVDGH